MLDETVAATIYPTLRLRALQLTHGDGDRADGLLQEAMLRLCQPRRLPWTVPTAGRYARLTLRSLACRQHQD